MGLTSKPWVKLVILILIIGIFMLIKWTNKKTEGFAASIIYIPNMNVDVADVVTTGYTWAMGIGYDSGNNLYVTDFKANKLLKNNAAFAVTGVTFSQPWGLSIDSSDNIYVANNGGSQVFKISSSGAGTIYATSSFTSLHGIVVDKNTGNIYVCDNHYIKKIDTNKNVTIYAGQSGSGRADGNGGSASFNAPLGITIDSAGNLYVTDSGNNSVRKIDTGQNVTTIAGSSPSLPSNGLANATLSDGPSIITNVTTIPTRYSAPSGIVLDSIGNIYISENGNNAIRKIDTTVTPNQTYTIAGVGVTGNNNNGNSSKFYSPYYLTINNNIIYVADSQNARIRKITLTPNCPAGQYAQGIACAPCASGYYNPNTNQTSCQPCSPGTYSTLPSGSNTGAIQCTPCTKPTGSQGMTSSNAATSSASCKASSCDSGYGFNSNAGTCTQCVSGNYSGGGTSICSNCPGATYSTSNGMSACTSCASNQYTASTGANSSNLCLSLPTNSKFNILGGFLCMLGFSQSSSNCSSCAAGSYNSNFGASNCGICGVGTYSGASASNCTTCAVPPGSVAMTSPSNSSSQSNCTATSCYPGYGYVNSNCVQCSGGFYGMGGTSTCTACSQPGYTTPLGSSNSNACYCANTNLPPKAKGSAPKLLTALNTCIPDGINVYNFTMGSNVTTMNPCTGQSFYDFDRQVCVDSYGNTVDGTSMTICTSNQIYNKDTNACQSVSLIVKPNDPQLNGTSGTPGPNNYNNCKTVDKGDCTILFKNSSGAFTSINPCLSNGTIYNFDTNTCTVAKNPCCKFTTAAAAIAGGCVASTENPPPTRFNTTNSKGPYYCGGNNAVTVAGCKQANAGSSTYKAYWNIPPAQFTAAHKASCSASGFTDYTNSSIENLIERKMKRILMLG